MTASLSSSLEGIHVIKVKLPNYLEEAQAILLWLLFVSSHPRETGHFSHGGPDRIEFMLLLFSWRGHRAKLVFKTLSASTYSVLN